MKLNISFTPGKLFLASMIGILILGFVDYVTGYEVGFFVFYFVPIGFVAWSGGAKRSYVAAVTSAVVWFFADWFSGHPYSHTVAAFWNSGIRLVSFLMTGYIISRIKELLEKERQISNDLRAAQKQVKTLRDLLPICGNCKKIRNDKGYWQQIEEYLDMHSHALFRHGVCPECAQKLLDEVELELGEKASDDIVVEKGNGRK
ncbi:MAG: DUF4118 domain-containing protein [Desulfobacterales bacterium]|nr:DUF4118 domain-containing protein [Desulfobacterales bacterium]